MTTELELATTEEIVQELMKRSNFIGAIVWSPVQHRFPGQIHNDFRLYTTLNQEVTQQLLQNCVDSLQT